MGRQGGWTETFALEGVSSKVIISRIKKLLKNLESELD